MVVSKPPTSGTGEIDPNSHSLLAVQSLYSLTTQACGKIYFFFVKKNVILKTNTGNKTASPAVPINVGISIIHYADWIKVSLSKKIMNIKYLTLLF